MRELARHMGKNNFFKLFVGQYQKGLMRAIEAAHEENIPKKEGEDAKNQHDRKSPEP